MVKKVICNSLGNWGMGCIHPKLKVCSLCREAPTPGHDLEKVEVGRVPWCSQSMGVGDSLGRWCLWEMSARSFFPLGLCKRLYLSPNNSGPLEVTWKKATLSGLCVSQTRTSRAKEGSSIFKLKVESKISPQYVNTEDRNAQVGVCSWNFGSWFPPSPFLVCKLEFVLVCKLEFVLLFND